MSDFLTSVIVLQFIVLIVFILIIFYLTRKTTKCKWASANLGAGTIPYIYIRNEPHVVLGVRKSTVKYSGKLSLPNGHVDMPINGPKNILEWEEYFGINGNDFLLHVLKDTAIRETKEEAGISLDATRLEEVLWNKLSYSKKLNSYFLPFLYPCEISQAEYEIILKADTNEMYSWVAYSERDIHLLFEQKMFAITLEYEAVKLLFSKLRYKRNVNPEKSHYSD